MIKRIVASYFNQVWNRRDFRLLPYLFADECKVNYISNCSINTIISTPKDIRNDIEIWIKVYPDIKVNTVTLISDKQYVSAHYQLQGRHLGECKNIKPTGKLIEVDVMSIYKIERGKICEKWTNVHVDDVLKPIIALDKTSFVLS